MRNLLTGLPPKTGALRWERLAIRGYAGDEYEGMFNLYPRDSAVALRAVVSAAKPNPQEEAETWDHVSVSTKRRCPSWPEMCLVQEFFFFPHETTMQLHVPRAEWISNHPYCLHIFRPTTVDIPRPPSIMVGVQELGDLTKLDPAERAEICRAQGW